MALSAENTARLQVLHAKALAETISLEELREGVAILRQDRVAAQIASTKARKTAAAEKAPVDVASVLADLRNIGARIHGDGK